MHLSFSLQGTMTVTEYCDRFLQLARYAPAEVADDRKKQEHFMEVPGIQTPREYHPSV